MNPKLKKLGLIFIGLVVVFTAILFIGNAVMLESKPYKAAESFLKNDQEVLASHGEILNIKLERFKFFYKDTQLSILFRMAFQGATKTGTAYVKVTKVEESWVTRIVNRESLVK